MRRRLGRNPARSEFSVDLPAWPGQLGSGPMAGSGNPASLVSRSHTGPLATMTAGPDRETMGTPEVVQPGQKEIRHDCRAFGHDDQAGGSPGRDGPRPHAVSAL